MVNKDLKLIKLNNVSLYYKIESYQCGDYGSLFCYITTFYLTNDKIKKIKKYFLFGPLVERFDNDEIFVLHFNIESKHKTKKEIREVLNRKMELHNRQLEINRGELI